MFIKVIVKRWAYNRGSYNRLVFSVNKQVALKSGGNIRASSYIRVSYKQDSTVCRKGLIGMSKKIDVSCLLHFKV